MRGSKSVDALDDVVDNFDVKISGEGPPIQLTPLFVFLYREKSLSVTKCGVIIELLGPDKFVNGNKSFHCILDTWE